MTAARRPVRVLAAGDFFSPAGGVSALRMLLRHLAGDFEMHQMGISYSGDPHGEPWRIYPARIGGDPLGLQRLRPLVEALEPSLLFLVGDPWGLAGFMDRVRDLLPHLKVVLHCPVGGGPIPGAVVERLAGADRLVAYTGYGRRQLESAAAEVRRRLPEFELPPLDVIPLGVSTDLCFPEGDRPRESFLVLNANRPLPHARLDITLKGFALFAAGKPPSVKLCLPLALPEPMWKVPVLARRLGISNRLIAPLQPRLPVPAEMRAIYNASAVGLNTSVGESWGQAVFEHAATGAAQILPRHSVLEELWQGAARFVEPALSLTRPGPLVEDHYVSPEGVAEALEVLYRDRRLLEELSRSACLNATRPELRWAAVACRWRSLFQAVLAPEVELRFSGQQPGEAAGSAP